MLVKLGGNSMPPSVTELLTQYWMAFGRGRGNAKEVYAEGITIVS